MTQTDQHAIVLFDGVCNFCNASVRFIIARDRTARFQFAPLQSDVGRSLLAERGLPAGQINTIILIDHERVSTRSTAALRIAKHLTFPWWLAYYLFIWIPQPIRDVPYRIIARVRYRVFGRKDACPLPPPGVASRFLA